MKTNYTYDKCCFLILRSRHTTIPTYLCITDDPSFGLIHERAGTKEAAKEHVVLGIHKHEHDTGCSDETQLLRNIDGGGVHSRGTGRLIYPAGRN